MYDGEVEALAVEKAKNLLSKKLQKAIKINRLSRSIGSPNMDGMPKGTANGNSSENMMITVSGCRELIRDVSKALNSLDCEEFVALQERYIHDKTAVYIAQRLMVSRASVYRLINKGLSEFIYVYNQGQLLDEAADELAEHSQDISQPV